MVCIKGIVHIMAAEMESAAAPGVRPRRRNHSEELKRELVQRSLQPDASVQALAIEHGINANLLFAWHRAHLRATASASSVETVVPATLVPRSYPWRWYRGPRPASRQWPPRRRLAPTWRQAPSRSRWLVFACVCAAWSMRTAGAPCWRRCGPALTRRRRGVFLTRSSSTSQSFDRERRF